MARRGGNTDKMAKVLVGSIVSAVVVSIMGSAFSDQLGTSAQNIVDVAPVILVALGLYGAFQYM